MRSLVLSLALGGLIFSSHASAALTLQQVKQAAGCLNSGTGSEDPDSFRIRCAAVESEFNSSQYASYQRGYALDPNKSQADNQTEFDNAVTTLRTRGAQCCDSSGGCELVGTQPTGAAAGTPGSQCGIGAIQKWQGGNAAHGAGVCEAVQKICANYVNESQRSASGLDFTSANAICSNINPASQKSTAAGLYSSAQTSIQAGQSATVSGQCPPAGGGGNSNGNGNGNGNGPGGSQSNSGRQAGSQRQQSAGSGLGQLLSAVGPLLSQLAQQNQETPEDYKPPEIAKVDCSIPGMQPCPPKEEKQVSDSFNKGGNSAFQTASKSGGHNVGDTSGAPGTGNPAYNPGNSTNDQQAGGGATVIPNNTGGQPGGAGGGGGGMQTASAGGSGGGYAPQGSKTPDLGLGSHGSMAQLNSNLKTDAGGGGGGGGNFGGGAGARGFGEDPMNYADFLPKPGTPSRALAGGNLRPMMQIQSKEVNIWNRISEHFKQRCSLGLLRDCIP